MGTHGVQEVPLLFDVEDEIATVGDVVVGGFDALVWAYFWLWRSVQTCRSALLRRTRFGGPVATRLDEAFRTAFSGTNRDGGLTCVRLVTFDTRAGLKASTVG